MSSVSASREAMLDALGRALGRRFSARVVMYHQAVAERLGLSVTDLKCLDLVAEAETPLTAGQLAELSGLTTGAITGVLDRLEHAGFVRREPDPQDRRRVVLRARPERAAEIDALFAPLNQAQADLFAGYSDPEIALLLDYVTRGSALLQQETARLRSADTAAQAEDVSVAPLRDLTRGRFAFHGGMGTVSIHGGAAAGELYRAQFEGRPPAVQVRDGSVTMRYRGLGLFDWRNKSADVALNEAVSWSIDLRGGASMLDVDLQLLRLESLAVSGGASEIVIWLPRPVGPVPVRIGGGASSIKVHRPAGTAARVRVRGGASSLHLDAQRIGAVGDAWVTSSTFGTTDDRFDIEVSGGANDVKVDSVGA